MPRAEPEDVSDDGIDDMPTRGALAKTEVDIQAEEQLDNELEDDLEETTETATKKTKSALPEDEDDDDVGEEEAKNDGDGGEGDAGDDEEDFVVQKIVAHDFFGKQLRYRVRWVGYKAADDTWEPEENLLPGAKDALAAYHETTGGVPQPLRKTKSTGSLKHSQSTEDLPSKKRQKTVNGEEHWLPKQSNWEELIDNVDTVERSDNDDLMAFILFKNGKRTKVNMNLVYKHCPIAMLKFYENHLKFN